MGLPANWAAIDSEGMYGRVTGLASQLEEGLALGHRWGRHLLPGRVDAVVLCGMGGSAIGGDVARALLEPRARVPIQVLREEALPGHVGPRTLVVASSYSGETLETLRAAREGAARGARVIALTTGGALASWAKEQGFPVIPLPPGFGPPRAALGLLLVPLLVLLAPLASDLPVEAEVAAAAAICRGLAGEWGEVDAEPPPLVLARSLRGSLPVIYTGGRQFGAVAVRWRSQLAENAKVLATHHLFPELTHNEIMAWEGSEEIAPLCHAILLADARDGDAERQRVAFTRRVLEGRVRGLTVVESRGQRPLERMLSLLYFGDFVSIYLAFLRGVDPTPIRTITELKGSLRVGE